MDQTTQLFDAFLHLVTLVLPVIGVTGGIKGLISGLPDIKLGPWQIPDGLWLSWVIALGLRALAAATGFMPLSQPEGFASPELWAGAEWMLLGGLANYVRAATYVAAPSEKPITGAENVPG